MHFAGVILARLAEIPVAQGQSGPERGAQDMPTAIRSSESARDDTIRLREIFDALVAHASDELARGVADERVRKGLEQAGASAGIIEEVMACAARQRLPGARRTAIQLLVFGWGCLVASACILGVNYSRGDDAGLIIWGLLIVGAGYACKGLSQLRRATRGVERRGDQSLRPHATDSRAHPRRAAS